MLEKENLEITCVLFGQPNVRSKITGKSAVFEAHVLCEEPMDQKLEDAQSMIVKCRN